MFYSKWDSKRAWFSNRFSLRKLSTNVYTRFKYKVFWVFSNDRKTISHNCRDSFTENREFRKRNYGAIKLSSQDYLGTWVNGSRFSVGAAKFAGQTRKRKLLDGSIMEVTYGYNVIGKTGLVATVSEIIKKDRIADTEKYDGFQYDIVTRLLDTAYYENQWHEDSHV